jgi:general secretion pathway protein C
MSTPTQRWTIAGILLGVGLIGWMSAMGLTRFAVGYIAIPDGESIADVAAGETAQPEPGNSGRSRPSRTSKRTYVNTIVERSIFDSSKVGSTESDGPIDITDGSKTDLKVVLIATVVSDDEAFSSALIADEEGVAAGYGKDDQILGEATIVAIEPRKVVIQRTDGSVEYIVMEEDAQEQPQRSPRLPSRNNGEESGVESVGNNRYVVDSETLEKLMENPEQLYSQIRVVPHKDSNGEVDGYRLSGIRRRSFFYQLGVKNGDIVHSVNGKALTSASAGMEAYNTLADARDFSFELTRRNERQTFDYEVR